MIQSKPAVVKQNDDTKERCIAELQFLTGNVSKDLSYLYYLLVKDGTYFNKKESKVEVINDEYTVPSLEDWFKNL